MTYAATVAFDGVSSNIGSRGHFFFVCPSWLMDDRYGRRLFIHLHFLVFANHVGMKTHQIVLSCVVFYSKTLAWESWIALFAKLNTVGKTFWRLSGPIWHLSRAGFFRQIYRATPICRPKSLGPWFYPANWGRPACLPDKIAALNFLAGKHQK